MRSATGLHWNTSVPSTIMPTESQVSQRLLNPDLSCPPVTRLRTRKLTIEFRICLLW